ncbi:MAG: hypothetical protein AAGB13_17800 [Cyanobacteria bacterium P01_F01_bin.33]
MSQTIEGTWEEILTRAEELKGHRVRVTLLDVAEPGESLEVMLDGLVGSVSLHAETPATEAEIFVSEATLHERAVKFMAWATQPRPGLPLLSDEAISRESMYENERL